MAPPLSAPRWNLGREGDGPSSLSGPASWVCGAPVSSPVGGGRYQCHGGDRMEPDTHLHNSRARVMPVAAKVMGRVCDHGLAHSR